VSVHVGVNLLWLVPGVVGGSETYIVRLLRALAEDPPGPERRGAGRADVRVTLFLNRLGAEAYPDLCEAFDSEIAPVTGTAKPARVLAETTWLGVACRRRGIDVAHHVGGIAPVWRPVPTIVTIHDLQPFAFPEHFSTVKRTFTRVVVPPSVRTAARLTTLSRSTRDDVVRRLGADPGKVRIVPPGFDPPTAAAGAEARLAVRRRHELDDRPFFVYPAITYPHKGHEHLVRSFARVAAVRPDVLLVLPGGPAQREDALRALIAELGLGDRVRRLGWVAEPDLDALYREAVALVLPSRYEGFGMTVLEAMSRRCPVIAADATALPEVVGEAGLLVDPDDPAQWSAAMVDLLDDPARRGQLADAGEARARTFDWGRSAESLADVYRELAPATAAERRGAEESAERRGAEESAERRGAEESAERRGADT
jgi:glycosyltransferase involved in cell wall biosynthesis